MYYNEHNKCSFAASDEILFEYMKWNVSLYHQVQMWRFMQSISQTLIDIKLIPSLCIKILIVYKNKGREPTYHKYIQYLYEYLQQ